MQIEQRVCCREERRLPSSTEVRARRESELESSNSIAYELTQATSTLHSRQVAVMHLQEGVHLHAMCQSLMGIDNAIGCGRRL